MYLILCYTRVFMTRDEEITRFFTRLFVVPPGRQTSESNIFISALILTVYQRSNRQWPTAQLSVRLPGTTLSTTTIGFTTDAKHYFYKTEKKRKIT